LTAEAKASLLTIARCIEENDRYRTAGGEDGRAALDELLDSLT
jgi:hypothetical protein